MISRFLRRPGVRELALLAALYIGYSVIRTVASDDFHAAARIGANLLRLEEFVALDWERGLNNFVNHHR